MKMNLSLGKFGKNFQVFKNIYSNLNVFSLISSFWKYKLLQGI